MVYNNYFATLSSVPLDADADDAAEVPGRHAEILTMEMPETANLVFQTRKPQFSSDTLQMTTS